MRRLTAVLSLFALGGASSALAADTQPARGRSGVLVLTQQGTAIRVTGAGQAHESVAIPPGADIYSFRAVGNGWVAAGTTPSGEGSRLLLLASAPRAARDLVPPRTGSQPRVPVLLTSAGALAGLAWLEGNTVRAAARTASTWDDAIAVATAAAGTTMGLAGTVLADGTWLLLWSAFDGEDDEIYWSARDHSGAWSAPARLAGDNAVPDITPAVRTGPAGAVAAWSRYDGREYELVLSQFDGDGWSVPQRVAGAGALRPSFPDVAEGESDAPLLLYRSARPRGWAVVEGRAPFRELARSEDGIDERPLVERGAAGVGLRWSDAAPRRSP
jgi:hypothetical protein